MSGSRLARAATTSRRRLRDVLALDWPNMLANVLEWRLVERGLLASDMSTPKSMIHMLAGAVGEVQAVDPRSDDVGVRASVRVRLRGAVALPSTASISNGPPFVSPMKAIPTFSGRRRRAIRSRPEVRLALMAGDRSAVELALGLGPVVLADEADVDRRSGQDPRFVGSGEEDVARLA